MGSLSTVSHRPRLALVLITADVGWVQLSVAALFPARLEIGFQTLPLTTC